MFFPYTAIYGLEFDGHSYELAVWPFAEVLGAFAAAVMGLLCLWLALGRRHHWFIRLLPILAALTLIALIPAYDLGAAATTQCLVVFAATMFRAPKSMQFKLSHLLLAVFVVAAILGIFRNYSPPVFFKWIGILWFGVGYGVLTWIAWEIVSRKKNARSRIDWRWLITIFAPAVALMAVGLQLAGVNSEKPPRRFALSIFSLFLAAPVVAALTFLLFRAPIPKDSPPAENGLPALLAIGQMIPETRFRPYPKKQALVTAVDESTTALVAARAELERDGWLGVNYELKEPGDFEQRVPQRTPIGNLCMALLAEAELAETEKRIDDALASYRNILRLLEVSGRGGLPFDAALAAECEADSLGRVYALRSQMNAQQCKAWARFLVSREPVLEPVDLLVKRRRAWVDRIACWQDRLVLWWLRHLLIAPQAFNLKFVGMERDIYIGLQSIDFALRAHQLENSDHPTELSDLVPDYLPSILPDPTNRNGFRYRKIDRGYLLYSIGSDGVDDTAMLPAGSNVVAVGDVTADIVLLWRLLK